MNDYILRDTARRIIDSPRNREQMLAMLEDTPSEDVQPVRHRHWTLQEDRTKKLYGWHICSECGAWIGEPTNYCSNCGADMRGKQNG